MAHGDFRGGLRLTRSVLRGMEALLGYGSDGSEASESEACEPALKRARLEAARPAAAAAAPPLLPSADALLDGSYSPPPAAAQRALEQAVLHQGRERAFPHVTGNFATHVYVEVPTPPSCLGALEELLQLLQAQLPDLQPVVHAPSTSSSSRDAPCRPTRPQHAAAAAEPAMSPAASLPSNVTAMQATGGSGFASSAQQLYHISLSRTVAIQLDQIQLLVEELRRRLRQQDTFQIHLARLVVFCNDARTRTFLAVAAEECGSSGGGSGGSCSGDGTSSSEQEGCTNASSKGGTNAAVGNHVPKLLQRPDYSGRLVQMCHAVSGVFAAHGLPRFYADPQPHASVAWLLGDRQQELEAALEAPAVRAVAQRLAHLRWQLQPAAVVCKAGQRENVLWAAAT